MGDITSEARENRWKERFRDIWMSVILHGLLACPCKTERRNHQQEEEDGNLMVADQNRSLVRLSLPFLPDSAGSQKRWGERGKSQKMCPSPSSKFLESSLAYQGREEEYWESKLRLKSKEQHSVFKSTMWLFEWLKVATKLWRVNEIPEGSLLPSLETDVCLWLIPLGSTCLPEVNLIYWHQVVMKESSVFSAGRKARSPGS